MAHNAALYSALTLSRQYVRSVLYNGVPFCSTIFIELNVLAIFPSRFLYSFYDDYIYKTHKAKFSKWKEKVKALSTYIFFCVIYNFWQQVAKSGVKLKKMKDFSKKNLSLTQPEYEYGRRRRNHEFWPLNVWRAMHI